MIYDQMEDKSVVGQIYKFKLNYVDAEPEK